MELTKEDRELLEQAVGRALARFTRDREELEKSVRAFARAPYQAERQDMTEWTQKGP